MDGYALHLRKTDGWTHLGSRPDARKEPEVVVRALEGDVRFATADGDAEPTTDGVLVPEGEGRRLTGRHFYVRPVGNRPCLIVHRGLD